MTIREFEKRWEAAKQEILDSNHGPRTMEGVLDTEVSVETNNDIWDVNSVGNNWRTCGCADEVIIFTEELK